MRTALIYRDAGADPACVHETQQSLLANSSWQVQFIDAQGIIHSPWQQQTNLLIMPGGRSLPYSEKLNGQGNQKIFDFVAGGGNYLGICAGAYYAAAEIEFEKGMPLEVIKAGELNFFKGKAAGPVHGLGQFNYGNYQGALLTTINFNKKIYKAYYHGGSSFYGSLNNTDTQVLATYANLPQMPPAIVMCKVGAGRAILTGVHIEYSHRGIDVTKPLGSQLARQLQESELQRRQLFTAVLDNLL